MTYIQSFPFKKEHFEQIKNFKFGKNWPVVYFIHDEKEAYIGQTVNAYFRSKQHIENKERSKLKEIHIITDEEFNVSATLDIESWLIQYISADQKFVLQNGNGGLKNHNYYDKVKYETKFEVIWKNLQKHGLVRKDLSEIKNSDLFKYSPYKSLNDDQILIAKKIFDAIKNNNQGNFIIHGKPGTGKTILATYLFKFLKEKEETKTLNIGLVVPMTSLRKTIRQVFSHIKNLKSNMVIGPNDVVKNAYDILIIDEAHRLQRRRNIVNHNAFNKINNLFGFGDNGTQLDWITKSAKFKIFLYDENQSVKPSDIRAEDFKKLPASHFNLETQMRVEAGDVYINFIEDIFNLEKPKEIDFKNYDFKIFKNLPEMVDAIKKKDREHHLARLLAGYAWPWNTSKGVKDYDIEIGDTKLIWNSVTEDWVNSPNAVNEVGCIHTIQGYDLNYAGVIIGPELSYDPAQKKFKIAKEKYYDINGKKGIQDPLELEKYIINIYKTLMTRGIKGTYLYIADQNLSQYFDKITNKEPGVITKIISPYIKEDEMIMVPLVGSAPCGEPFLGESNTEDFISIPKYKLRKGSQYFVIRAVGDSMNLANISDGDLLLCRSAEKAETGDRVVVLLQDEYVTVKYYDKKDGRRILLPKSTNKKHKPIVPDEGDYVQGIVQEVIKI